MTVLMTRDVREALGKGPAFLKQGSLRYGKFAVVSKLPEAKRANIDALIGAGSDDTGRRVDFLTALDKTHSTTSFNATLGGRLIVDHNGGVTEGGGLALDRHFGMPYIPGSAVKGIAHVGARLSEVKDDDMRSRVVFGDPSLSGSVSFLAAYPIKAAPLEMDILTCHHPNYYSGKSEDALDNESPIPVAFPVVKAGAEFRFTIVRLRDTADVDVLVLAKEWLIRGITEHGIGAKTAAGYGWFSIPGVSPDKPGVIEPPKPDYDEVIYQNAITRPLKNKGLWQQLQQQMATLSKPQNVTWLERFRRDTAGKDFKDLRAKDWYPKS